MSNQVLIYGSGAQSIALVPTRVPTSATFGIIDLRYTEDSDEHVIVAAGTAAIVDGLSTTLTLAAGRGADRRVVTMTSVAGVVVGRRYQLQDARGRREAVTVDDVNVAAKTVRAREEIQGEYSSGSTFVGAEVRAVVPSTWCDNEEAFRAAMPAIVTWTLVGPDPQVIRETIGLERARTHLATTQDVLQAAPTLAQGRAGRTELPTALAQAHVHYQGDLRLAGISPDAHHAGDLGRQIVTMLAIFYALQPSNDESDVRTYEWAKERYAELRAGLIVGRDKAGVIETDRTSDTAKMPDIRSLVRPGW